jgi:transcription initiation factor TFIID TATA-box-binding protein
MRKPKFQTKAPSTKLTKKRKHASGSTDEEQHAPSYPLRISNVVCTAWVGKPLSLRMVQLASQGRLDASVFPSSVSRAKYPATTNSVFDTGRILITGAPSTDYALFAAMRFVDKLNRELHEDMHVLNFKPQNIVSSFSLGYRLNIDMFYVDQKSTEHGTAHYDPSLFRGCSWKPLNGMVFVLFASGRVVLTGARTWEDAQSAYTEALPILEKYRLAHEYKRYDGAFKRTRDVDVMSQQLHSETEKQGVPITEAELDQMLDDILPDV